MHSEFSTLAASSYPSKLTPNYVNLYSEWLASLEGLAPHVVQCSAKSIWFVHRGCSVLMGRVSSCQSHNGRR